MPAPTLDNEQLGSKIEELTDRASKLTESLSDSASADEVKAVQDKVDELTAEIGPLLQAQESRLTQESIKSLTGQVTDLSGVVKDLREGFRVPSFDGLAGSGDAAKAYMDGTQSLFKDIALAHEGGKAGRLAEERLDEHLTNITGGKAMTEGTDSAGGYLVDPQKLGFLPLRERAATLASIFPSVRVNTDSVEFVSQTGGLTAGWAAELAAKPGGVDMTFATLQASVFTAAGLAVASNQLLEDSSIDRLILADLRKRADRVVEQALLSGTGTGQPRGILNTSGVQTVNYTDASPTVGELLNAIALSIAQVIDNNLSEPTHIVMRPQTWTKIITDADAQGKFTFGAGVNDPGNRTAADPFPIQRTLFGYPVVLSGLMPSNLGAGTNETRVITLDASDQLLLERSAFTVDKSEHVYFTSNQTVFRGERRVGFTAARYPNSISVVQGTGLINTAF